MLWATHFFFFFLLPFITSKESKNGGKTSKDDSSKFHCGTLSIAHKLDHRHFVWRRNTDRKRKYSSNCKVSSARYDCSRFQTSAVDYELVEVDDSPFARTKIGIPDLLKIETSNTNNNQQQRQQSQQKDGSSSSKKGHMRRALSGSNKDDHGNCEIPGYDDLLTLLTSHRPTNIFMIGDSHMRQIFTAIACLYSKELKDYIVHTKHRPDDKDFKQIVTKYDDLPSCRGIYYKDYPRFHIKKEQPPGTIPDSVCHFGHGHSSSCITFPGVGSGDDAKKRSSTICYTYVRPAVGKEAVEIGFNGLSSTPKNFTVNDFDIVVANTYMWSKPLAEYLTAHKFQGRVLAIHRYNWGIQKNFVMKDKIIKEVPQFTHASLCTGESGECIHTFCDAFLSAKSEDKDKGGKDKTKGSSSSSSIGAKDKQKQKCITLDMTFYEMQRLNDSKAGMYPMQYTDSKGKNVVCASNFEDDHSRNACVGKDAYTCEKTPCNEETHFCLPGPPDEFAKLILAAAISHDDVEV